MFSVKRPSAKDSEDDLLQFQQEFLKEKSKPAATVKNHVPGGQAGRASSEDSSSKTEKTIDEVDVSSKPVVFDVRECNIINSNVIPPSRKVDPFPKASRRNTDVTSAKGRKSIFAQQMENSKKQAVKKLLTTIPAVKVFGGPILIDGSGLGNVSAELEVENLHKENIAKLSTLTEEEILTEQSLLLEKLDPKLVEFVRKKKFKLTKTTLKEDEISSGTNLDQSDAGTSADTCESNISSRRNFPSSSTDSDFKILKMSKDYDREGIILKTLPEEIITDKQDETGVAYSHEMEPEIDIELPEEELPINPKEASKWPHMDKIEKRKLEWMTMLPKPKPVDLKSGFTARFDFQGKLMLRDENVPTQKGLHHHSEEAELPGYTVEELFLLSRSSVQSQRVMALQTLAYIMEDNWQGMFDGCFEDPLLVYLLNAGIAPLLRWALDDTADSCIAASIMAIHHLLLCSTDELCLDMVFPWINGHMSPFIKPYDTEQVPEENQEELTDAGIIKLDVIKGFLRMDILPRLKYIIMVMCPPVNVCHLIIEILIRFARHSYESAKKVMECSLLIETIFKKFLPTSWNLTSSKAETSKTNDFIHPVPRALKLIRIICCSSIDLASDLIVKHHLDSLLSCYVSLGLSGIEHAAVSLPKLLVEAFRTWHVLLTYGFCTEIYIDLFPIILRQLQCFEAISIKADSDVHMADCMFASLFLKVLESIVAATDDDNNKELTSCGSNSSFPVASVMWHHVFGLFPIVKNCLQKWLYEFSHGKSTTAGSVLLASCIDFFSTYCIKAKKQMNLESSEVKNIQNVITDYLLPCIKSVNFAYALHDLRSYSVLLYSGSSGTKRNTSTLTSLGTILWKDDIVPVLKDGTPFPLITSVLGLLTTLPGLLSSSDEEAGIPSHHLEHRTAMTTTSGSNSTQHNRLCCHSLIGKFPKLPVILSSDNVAAKIILLHPSVIQYVTQVAGMTIHFSHWFDRFEVAFFFRLIELASLQVCGDPTIWYKLSLSLLSNIRRTDEWIVKYLMEEVIFNDALLMYHYDRSSPLIHEGSKVEGNNINDNCCKGDNLKEKLQRISQVYVDFFLSSSSVKMSRQKWLKTTYNSHVSIEDDLKSIIPYDWPYEPLLVLYQQSKNGKIMSSELTEKVRAFLEWIYLSQQLYLPAFNHISPSAVFCHLCMVFILDSSVFFDTKIKDILQSNLYLLVRCENLKELEKIQWNVNSKFDDLLADLVVQFEAESYGDYVFANYLLVAFQQCYPSRWKNFLFIEHPQAVQSLRIPLSQLTVPLVNFLEPKETDTVLLSQYFKGLISKMLIPERSPLLYLMAVHHLHSYIFMTSAQCPMFQKMLLMDLMLCNEKEVICHVLLYSNPNGMEKLGFEMAEQLTPENELHLRNLYGKPIEL